jgi:hypothetical protein
MPTSNGLPNYTDFLSENKAGIKPPNTVVTDKYNDIFDQNMVFLVAAAAAELDNVATTDLAPRSLSEFAAQTLLLKQEIIRNEKLTLLGVDFNTLKTDFTTLKTDFTTFKTEFNIFKNDFNIFKTDFNSLKERGVNESLGIVSRGISVGDMNKDNRGLIRMALDDSGMKETYLAARQSEVDTPMIPSS